MKISDYAVKHPVVIVIICCSVALFGYLAATSMNQEMFPDVSAPRAFILTVYPGMSAAEVEDNITVKLEDSLEILSDLKTIQSTSLESVSLIQIFFNDNVTIYEKLPEIREKLSMAKGSLPSDLTEDSVIIPAEGSSLLPIYTLKISGNVDPDYLQQRIENQLIPKIRGIDGISGVKLLGNKNKIVKIELKIDQMVAKGVSALDIFGLVQYFNVSMPGGTADFRGKNLTIRTQGQFTKLSEIENLVVAFKDQSKIYLKDVAEVSFDIKPEDYKILSNGSPVFAMDIYKKATGNTIDIVKKIQAIEAEESARSEGQLQFEPISDQSKSTRMSISTVLSSAGLGVLFAVIVIYLFLRNIRSTLIIACSLPLSILITAIGMFVSGKTLNILTLSGLTVAIGMIVDCSIVILENIHNHYHSGEDEQTAAMKGASEVGGAILASTTTSVSVFLPLAFLSGIIGIVMKDLSITIVIALIASAFVAVIVVPFLASKLLRVKKERKPVPGFKAFDRFMGNAIDALSLGYRNFLTLCLRHSKATLITAVALLLASLGAVLLLGISFIPPTDTGELEIAVIAPQSYSLAETEQKAKEIERYLADHYPSIENEVFYVGYQSVMAQFTEKNKALGRVKLIPYEKRKENIHQLIKRMQEDLSGCITDVDITVNNGGFDSLIGLTTGGQGFKVNITGPKYADVLRTAHLVRALIAADKNVNKALLDVEENNFELVTRLRLDLMANVGLSPKEATAAARMYFYGLDAGRFSSGEKSYPIFITSDLAGKKIDSGTIERIALVSSQTHKVVPFSSFSQIEMRESVPLLKRSNRIPTIEITGQLNTTDLLSVSTRLQKQFKALNLPDGVEIKIAGVTDLLGDSLTQMTVVLLIALFLVYMVMVIQFEEFTQPLIIMFSIPFCFIGVIFGLLIFGSDINLFAMLGVVALAGTVVNNAIVMVDYFNIMRKQDPNRDLKEIVTEGAVSRLQPILMTTLTTLFGVLPMCFAKGNGAALYAPLGQAIAGGLFTSSLISLFLIPILYHWLEKKEAPLHEGEG